MKLNRLSNIWNRDTRNDMNENFDEIERNFNGVVDVVSNKAYEQVIDNAKLNWLEPVPTFADLSTTYPNASEGDTVMAREVINGVNKVYRYNGTEWKEIQQISADAVNEVDNRLTQQLAQIETNPSFKTTAVAEQPTLAAELINDTGWTSTGWTGDYATGFTHVTGQTSPLIVNIPSLTGETYLVTIVATNLETTGLSGTSDFYVSLGGSTHFETYKGTHDIFTFVFGIKSLAENQDLVITPRSGWTGKVLSVSLKKLELYSLPAVEYKNSDGETVLEQRFTKSVVKGTNLDSIFIGKMSGARNIEGDENTAFGNYTLENNTTGFWSTAIGNRALRNNTVGSRCIAIGRLALEQNITGDRNISIGTFSLSRNTHGRNNVAVGADALWKNTVGNGNIGFGTLALGENVDGNNNFAAGYDALGVALTGDDNIAIGYQAGRNITGDNNIAFGRLALQRTTSASHNIAIGLSSLEYNVTGDYNVGVGIRALYNNRTGTHNIAFGRASLYDNRSGEENIAFGTSALGYNQSATHSIAIGKSALEYSVGAKNNIALGNSALNKTTTSNNIAIGAESLRDMQDGLGDNIGIGVNAMIGLTDGDGNVAIGTGAISRRRTDTSEVVDMQRNVVVGKNAGVQMGNGSHYNVLLGSAAGATLISGQRNILIGYDVNTPLTTTSNHLNIGNTIKADMTSKVVELSKLRLTDLPTSAPVISGMVWNDNGTLKVS